MFLKNDAFPSDNAFGLTNIVTSELLDKRTDKNALHSILALLRQSIFSRLAGYDDTNDAERLCVDPAMRQFIGGRAKQHQAASTSQMERLETEILTLTTLRKKLIKIEARAVKHSGYFIFQMAEVCK